MTVFAPVNQADCFKNFFTGYVDETGTVVFDHKKIVVTYLKGTTLTITPATRHPPPTTHVPLNLQHPVQSNIQA